MTARLLWLMVAVAAVAVLASLGRYALDAGMLSAGRTSTIPEALRTPPGAPPGPQARDLAAIETHALFGAAPVAAPDRVAPKPADLGLVLHGVLADSEPARSRAFIAGPGGLAGYRIGDAVAPEVTLTGILPDAVTLRAGTEQVTLRFDGAVRDASAPAPAAAASPKPDPMARLRAAIVPGRGSIDLRDTPAPETMDEHIALWRARIIEDPAAVMQTIGLERTGRGYRIKQDPDIGVTLAGLRPGDLVTRLNGQTLGDLDRDRALYDAVAEQGVARLEVERAGETVLMTYSLR